MSQSKALTLSQTIRALFSRKHAAKQSLERPVPALDIKALQSRGNALLAQGKISEANVYYRQAAELTPNDPLAQINLGYGLLELGELPAAKKCFELATQLDAKVLDGHFLLGQVLVRQGLHEQAVQHFETAISLKPDFHFAWFELGRARETLGKFSAALDDYYRVLALDKGFVGAMLGQVRMLLALERWQEVLLATDLNPDQLEKGLKTELLLLKARALLKLERLDEALSVVDQILQLDPQDVRALHGKATIFMAAKSYEPALNMFQQVLVKDAVFFEALSNAGAACQELGRLNQAADFLDRALAIEPEEEHSVYNMSRVLMRLDRCNEAVAMAGRGLVRHPLDANLHWTKAIGHLLMGDLRSGWAHYEWRWQATDLGERHSLPAFTQPQWRGEPLEGKTILLYAEQGMGDTIQMLRYLSPLADRGARIFLSVPPGIRPLCGGLKKYCVLLDDMDPALAFDYQCPLFSLPLAFDTVLETIPAQLPYLSSEPELRASWEEKLGPRRFPRVGLVWSGNAANANDKNRSIPLSLLMAGLPDGFQWVSLQKEVRPSDLQAFAAHDLFDASEDLRTFADTAALVDCMDLVISVDTSVAHLTGALGKPLWILLPHSPDWRWMREREDSPWYPSARLLRQPKGDGSEGSQDWEEVVQRIASDLKHMRPMAHGPHPND